MAKCKALTGSAVKGLMLHVIQVISYPICGTVITATQTWINISSTVRWQKETNC